MDPDPDDIIREVNEDSQDECAAEILRLKRKRRGFRAAFTEIQNVVDRLWFVRDGFALSSSPKLRLCFWYNGLLWQ